MTDASYKDALAPVGPAEGATQGSEPLMYTGIIRIHREQIVALKHLLDREPDLYAVDVSELEYATLHVVAHTEEGFTPEVGTISAGGTWRDIEVVR